MDDCAHVVSTYIVLDSERMKEAIEYKIFIFILFFLYGVGLIQMGNKLDVVPYTQYFYCFKSFLRDEKTYFHLVYVISCIHTNVYYTKLYL